MELRAVRWFQVFWLCGLCLRAGESIPDRPEKLEFPPLQYSPPHADEYRVALKSGPVAYLVPDHELPLVNLSILVRTGAYLEPADKTGLANFTGYLLTRGGIGEKTADELEERLAFLAASLTSGIGDDQGIVNLNLLAKDLDEGLGLLRQALTAPRFQADKLELYRDQTLQALRQRNDDSSAIEARESEALAYGTNAWISRNETDATVKSITVADLHAFHQKWFQPSNFVVAASGDFDRDSLVSKLEQLFSSWPFSGEVPPPIPTNFAMAKPGVYVVDKDVNQGRVSLLLPGVRRDSPDFPAVLVMNDILGGGGFTSRIMNRVRSDEGLAYGAGSAFPGGVDYALPFRAGLASKSRTVAYAASLVIEEMHRISDQPVSSEELNTAKRSFIDTFPQTFNTKGKIAGQFARDEFTGRHARDPGFWDQWRQRIDSVTQDEVQRVARKYLTPDRAILLVVGKKDEILKGHPDHPVTLGSLVPGGLVELPLRDPLTLTPLDNGTKKVE
jgi:predicted Zn-dependent peptidase